MNYRPTKLSEVVGQEQIKNVCDILVKAARKQKEPIGHTLFGGPSGYGKTTFAKVLANEMGSNFTETNAVSISTVKKLKTYVERVRENDILFIDEIHGLSQNVCEWLYTVMEDFEYTEDKTGKRTKVPPFTLIGATTESGDLPGPLKGRFEHVQEFTEYTEEELKTIVENIVRTHKMKPGSKVCEYIAKVSRGIPRLVVNNTKWFHKYMIVHQIKKLNTDKLKEIMAMKGVYEYGLTKQDMRYIETLYQEGKIGLNSLASKIDVTPMTIKNDIEPYLQRLGLIEIGTGGRSLNVPRAIEMELVNV